MWSVRRHGRGRGGVTTVRARACRRHRFGVATAAGDRWGVAGGAAPPPDGQCWRKGNTKSWVKPFAVRIAPITARTGENANIGRSVDRMATDAVTMAIWRKTSAKSKYGSRFR